MQIPDQQKPHHEDALLSRDLPGLVAGVRGPWDPGTLVLREFRKNSVAFLNAVPLTSSSYMFLQVKHSQASLFMGKFAYSLAFILTQHQYSGHFHGHWWTSQQ